MSVKRNSSLYIALLALFMAITATLQVLSSLGFLKIGVFNLSLVLIPIVIGGVLYGPVFSSVLGLVFSIIVIIGCVNGTDIGGNIMFNAHPALTVFVCLLKGILCGTAAGVVGSALRNKNTYLATVLAAIAAPVVNTGIFLLLGFLFFKDIFYSWAGGTNIVYYTVTGLVGINFLIELGLNMLLSPAIVRVIKTVKKY